MAGEAGTAGGSGSAKPRAAEDGAVLPGGTVGVLGGGQLGRMLGQAARRMGYRFVVFDPQAGCPAAAVADEQIVADYDDAAALRRFAGRVDVVTFEFENVPAGPLAGLAETVAVRPSPKVLETCRHRAEEKRFVEACGAAVAPWRACATADEARSAGEAVGGRGVMKTAEFGYDGKGQRRFDSAGEAAAAWEELGGVACVAEGWVDFDREVSTLVARSPSGEAAVYPVVENRHVRHILDTTLAPAPGLSEALAEEARRVARSIAERVALEGLLAVEMFVVGGSRLVVNELAPRPHNSGHYTIEACVTDQFEQQLRAVCGLPLGDASMKVGAAAMGNLLGEVYRPELVTPTVPAWAGLLGDPEVKLHLYGKRDARAGRKMGHVTATGGDVASALRRVEAAREKLGWRAG
ncbi:MAG: 5-(carboxyamino)imidazole ribonucleotide synthase [Planctomycetota bacterium]